MAVSRAGRAVASVVNTVISALVVAFLAVWVIAGAVGVVALVVGPIIWFAVRIAKAVHGQGG